MRRVTRQQAQHAQAEGNVQQGRAAQQTEGQQGPAAPQAEVQRG